MRRVNRWLVLVLILVPFISRGQSEEIVQDFERSLLIYNESSESYVPHPYNTPFRDNVASFVVDVNDNRGLFLKVCMQPESALFIDQEIVAVKGIKDCLLLSIDSLQEAYQKESLFFSIYNKNLSLKETSIYSLNLVLNENLQSENDSGEIEVTPREAYPFKDFYIVGLLVLLSAFVLLKQAYPKTFSEYYNLGHVLSIRWREDSIFGSRAISSTNLLFLFVYSLAMAFVILTLWYETGSAPQELDFIAYSAFSSSFFSWIILTVLVFILMIVKYFLIWITSSLLGFKEMVSFHFLDFMRISQLLVLLLLCITTFSIISFSDFITPGGIIFPYIILLCISVTFILLFIKLLSTSSHRNVHLFSYLCTTEILPMIIGIKFFLNL